MTLSIGFSPCPNDTFIFHALVHGYVHSCPHFAAPVLADVETLNEWAMESKLDVTKISFHALGHVLDEYVLLRSGSALGRGCGPLLVSRQENEAMDIGRMTVAIPGHLTTATMLLRLFVSSCQQLVPMRFDRIMEAVQKKDVDAGVIIHESRFTFQQYGLICLQDLGLWWEEISGHPIPLGGIAARRSLGKKRIRQIDDCIRSSVRLAFESPDQSRDYIKQHARELDDQVLRDHIGLYVNSFTEDLGQEGLAAVAEFMLRGSESGIFQELLSNVLQID